MTNEKAPERVWIWTGEPYQWHDTKTDDSDVEYVRADLLATARKEEREAAFKEMIELAQSIRPDGSINFVGDWSRARKQFIALLEAALTENRKGEG